MANTKDHTTLTKAEKLQRLRRARNLLVGGYPISMCEKRLHTSIHFLRQWATELKFELEKKL